jgi:hypothetical protein
VKVKSVEIIVKEVIELDRKTDQELLEIQEEIQSRKDQFKLALDQIMADSEEDQIAKGKALYHEMMEKAAEEKEKILKKSLETTMKMEEVFNQEKESILLKAIQATAYGKWES